MVQRDLDVGLIARTGARAEQWRYQVESAVRARASALAAGDGRYLDDPHRNFEEVDKRMTHPFSSWSIAVRGRWALPEDIFRTEGRAAVLAMRHALRRSDQYGKHTLVLVDNLGLALALGKVDAPPQLASTPVAKDWLCQLWGIPNSSSDGCAQNTTLLMGHLGTQV